MTTGHVTYQQLLEIVRQFEESRKDDMREVFAKLDALRDTQAERRANCERQDGRIIALERAQKSMSDRQDDLERDLVTCRKDLEEQIKPVGEKVTEWKIKASFLGVILALLLSLVSAWDKIKVLLSR